MLKKIIIQLKKPKLLLRKVLFVLNGRIIKLSPKGKPVGRVLLSYNTDPFVILDHQDYGGHSQYWEINEIANSFLEKNYKVDVINFNNNKFVPSHNYNIYVDIGANLNNLVSKLNKDCYKIFYATGSHWLFQNLAELLRLRDLQERRGVGLAPTRQLEAITKLREVDMITGVCGTFPSSTYDFLNKKKKMIPISTTHIFESPESKNFTGVSKTFIWFGGVGAIHKGLDIVLEAFKEMPDYKLFVCGKSVKEAGFIEEYHEELFKTENIIPIGHIDPGSEKFKEICSNSLGTIFTSCSEGASGSVVLTMHAGLIPIVNKESGVETKNFGVLLEDSTVSSIKLAVKKLSEEPVTNLKERSLMAWKYVNKVHTRENFAKEFRILIDSVNITYTKK